MILFLHKFIHEKVIKRTRGDIVQYVVEHVFHQSEKAYDGLYLIFKPKNDVRIQLQLVPYMPARELIP